MKNHKPFVSAIALLAISISHCHAAVYMAAMEENPGPGMIDFTIMGQINPEVTTGGTTVSFGSLFVGQTLGTMPNEVIDSSPTGPLRLDPNAPDVGTIFEISAREVVLGGADNGTYLTTPLAMLFADPVREVSFDLGHLDGPGTTTIEAFDIDGNSLGQFSNFEAGWQSIRLADASGQELISGVSIFVPQHGMDWEGFALDHISFSFSETGGGDVGDPDPDPDPDVIPEPMTLVIWSTFIGIGCVGSWFQSQRRKSSSC